MEHIENQDDIREFEEPLENYLEVKLEESDNDMEIEK